MAPQPFVGAADKPVSPVGRGYSEPEVIFEGDDLSVSIALCDSDVVVIAFSNFFSGPGEAPPFAEKYLLKNRLASVSLRAKRNHWWQTKEKRYATALIRKYVVGYSQRVTYGTSMGGYGALAWAGDVLATRALTIGPQTVITDPSVPLHTGWRREIDRFGVIRDAVDKDLPADLVPDVIFDPFWRFDVQHVRWLSQRRAVNSVSFPFATHSVLETFKQAGILQTTFPQLLRGTIAIPELKTLYRANRAKSFNYLSEMAIVAVRRGHLTVAQKLANMVAEISPEPRRKELYDVRLNLVQKALDRSLRSTLPPDENV